MNTNQFCKDYRKIPSIKRGAALAAGCVNSMQK